MNHIGKILRTAREAAGLTAAQLAAQIGMRYPNFRAVEHGDRAFPWIYVERLPASIRYAVGHAMIMSHLDEINRIKSLLEEDNGAREERSAAE